MKNELLGKTPNELKEIVKSFSLPQFTANQIADWLYKKHVKSVDQMTNLSKSVREKLSEKYCIGLDEIQEVHSSSDGTKKYLFNCYTSNNVHSAIESVIIPDDDRVTICISSQAGCKMNCAFCMTGRQGYNGNLSVASILSQILQVSESKSITNVVYMGMGEPLDNLDNVLKSIEVLTAEWGFAWSPKRITLSTIGVTYKHVDTENEINPLKEFLERTKVHLAVSLHNPFPEQREELMPAEKAFEIEKTLDLIRRYDFTGQRRVSFEYIMFDHLNDSKRHADGIIRLLRGLECRVNLIRFHKIPDSTLSPSPIPVIEQFKKRLNDSGIVATLRASRGEDILAACGMLSGKKSANRDNRI